VVSRSGWGGKQLGVRARHPGRRLVEALAVELDPERREELPRRPRRYRQVNGDGVPSEKFDRQTRPVPQHQVTTVESQFLRHTRRTPDSGCPGSGLWTICWPVVLTFTLTVQADRSR
jgi:hypothetical protein